MEEQITFIGAGNMARALIGGMMSRGHRSSSLMATARHQKTLDELVKHYPIQTSLSNIEAIQGSSVVILAMKPQAMTEVLDEIIPVVEKQQPLLISVVAGANSQIFIQRYGAAVSFILAMPNTPALIGKGMTAIFASPATRKEKRQKAEAIFSSVGKICFLDKEQQLHSATATSGSGPGYYFLVFEKLSCFLEPGFLKDFIYSANHWQPQRPQGDGQLFDNILNAHYFASIKLGLGEEQARQLVRETALGSCYLALEGNGNFAGLRQQVTSKNGTTEAGLNILNVQALSVALEQRDSAMLNKLFEGALNAANKRATELAALLI